LATTKTDNKHLAPKLLLRRHFLQQYHTDTPPRVLDCCQGSGVLWSRLLKEFPVTGYWGMDKKPKKGRVLVDSARILASGSWQADVIDIDPYGEPWAHWFALLRTGQAPLTVFLTVGMMQTRIGGGGLRLISKEVQHVLGVDRLTRKVAPGLLGKLHEVATDYCLRSALSYGWTVVECQEALPSVTTRYFGLRLERSTPA